MSDSRFKVRGQQSLSQVQLANALKRIEVLEEEAKKLRRKLATADARAREKASGRVDTALKQKEKQKAETERLRKQLEHREQKIKRLEKGWVEKNILLRQIEGLTRRLKTLKKIWSRRKLHWERIRELEQVASHYVRYLEALRDARDDPADAVKAMRKARMTNTLPAVIKMAKKPRIGKGPKAVEIGG